MRIEMSESTLVSVYEWRCQREYVQKWVVCITECILILLGMYARTDTRTDQGWITSRYVVLPGVRTCLTSHGQMRCASAEGPLASSQYTYIVIRGWVIKGCVMRGCVIRGCVIRGCVMRGCVIRGCVIRGCVMWGCVIRGCVIRGCVVRGCVMRGCIMRGYVISGGVIRGGVIRVCRYILVDIWQCWTTILPLAVRYIITSCL